MLRVSEDMPCPICKKPDGCLVSPDGKAALCSRVESDKLLGEPFAGGWLHILDGSFKPTKIRKKNHPPINWKVINDFYQRQANDITLISFIQGFLFSSLKRLGVGYDGEAYTFPMRNSKDDIVGIQRRFLNGDKRFVKGSKNGLFIPRGLNIAASEVLICEGVTDTLVALDLGFEAIGRANCGTGVKMLCDYFAWKPCAAKIIIIADNDLVGIKGAKQLAMALLDINRTAHIIIPPVSDLREWVKKGLTKVELKKNLDMLLDNLSSM